MSKFPPVRAGVLLVRPWQAADAEAYGAVVRANASHLHRFPFSSDPPLLAYRIGTMKRSEPLTAYSLGIFLADTGSIVGEIEVNIQEDGAHVLSVWIADSATRHGHGRESVNAVVLWIFANTDASRVDALVEKDNGASIRLFESLAFVNVGNGTRNDFVYSLSRYAFDRVR